MIPNRAPPAPSRPAGPIGATALRGAAAVALVVAAAACASPPDPPRGNFPTGRLEIATGDGEVTLEVWIADSAFHRARGLMGVEELESDSGMAFLFDRPSNGGFWMKNTLIPLSIAFWDEKGRIVRILDMEPCERDPCPVYEPGVEYVGAVEANQGFFADRGIRKGDMVRLLRD